MSNRRTGKIARLPHELRQEVNRLLRDGVPYPKIITALEKRDVFGVSEQNLTNWKDGGFQDWLKQQERIEEISVRRDASLEMVKALSADGKTSITDANELLLASQVNEALQDFDPALLKELMTEKPNEFFRLAQTVISQTNEKTKREKLELELTKYRDHVAEQKRKIEECLSSAKNKGGLSPETLKRIEEAASLL